MKSSLKNELEIKGIEERNIEYCIYEMKMGIYGKIALIENIRGVGYRYSVEGFSLFYKEFSTQDKLLLNRAVDELKGLGKNEVAGALSVILHRTDSENKDEISNFIDYEKPVFDSGLIHFEELYHCILEKQTITILYRPFGKNESESKTVFPYLLKEHRNRWYLVAFDNSVGMERIVKSN